jgi:hypothetical protein
MPYVLHIKDLADDAVEVTSADQPSLAVIRDETKLHGFEVGKMTSATDGFCFRAKSDQPGKVREFLMSLTDVQTV